MRYDVLDQNGDVLESTDLWWITALQRREYGDGATIRDNEPVKGGW